MTAEKSTPRRGRPPKADAKRMHSIRLSPAAIDAAKKLGAARVGEVLIAAAAKD